MAQTIKLKRSSTEGKVPTTSQLALGEIAINTYDGRIFFEKNDGSAAVEQILTTDSITTGSVSITGSLQADNLLFDGATISSDLELVIDSSADIVLDADGADILLKDGGTAFGRFNRTSSHFVIKSETNDKDIIFKGVDNSSTISALTLDMSAAGAATFHGGIADAGTIAAGTWNGSAISTTYLSNTSGTNTGDVTLANTNYLSITGQAITGGTVPIGSGGTGATSAGAARTALGVDAAGTDNSTDVSLTGTPDYITISGQVITRNQIDLANDVTGVLPSANLDSDTAHLSGTQTFSGAKTFSSPVSVTNGTHIGLTIVGSGTSHTQGAIALKSSTSDTPEARGQGVFMFNEGDDSTFYMGTQYQDADTWQIGRATGTSINTEAAESGNAFLKISNAGVVTVDASTQSTTKTTGALLVDGGVGIAKTLNVGEDVVAYASSDERYKDNIIPIRNPNEKIKQIGGYTFDWNDKHEIFKGKKDIGVVAQEIEKVLPEIVETRDNGYKAVKYEKIVALLIESNKELIKRVEELESKIK